jgi:hypothetical protein
VQRKKEKKNEKRKKKEKLWGSGARHVRGQEREGAVGGCGSTDRS